MKTDIEIAQEAKMVPIWEVAEKLGISRSYVSRIEKKVIIDLRKKFKADEEEEKDKT